MIFHCKLCGGAVTVQAGRSICVCEYCSSVMTVPVLTDEQIADRYNHANQLRRAHQFDSASSVYEEILSVNPRQAEACWGAFLCHYGIEYVLDPHSEIYKPTFYKVQFTAVEDDDRYQKALQYALPDARRIYEADGAEIERIRKLYFELSETKEPYDIFISYKERDDASGRLTKDYEIANSLYNRLTGIGYRVFFSHVSLENVAGEAYEPIIFAALKSAKIMLAVGTSKKYYCSEWVRNEWERFRKKTGPATERLLIPVYSDILSSDLPAEFSALQAVDFSAVGAAEDLLHYIENYIPVSHGIASSEEQLLSRVKELMEQGDFSASTLQYLDNYLNLNPRNSDVYLLKLQLEFGLQTREELETLNILPDDHPEWKKAIYTASPDEAKHLHALRNKIHYSFALRCALGTAQEKCVTIAQMEARLQRRLENESDEHWNASNYKSAITAIEALKEKLSGVPGIHALKIQNVLKNLLERTYKEQNYQAARSYIQNVSTIEAFRRAKAMLMHIREYKDSEKYLLICQKEIEQFDSKARKTTAAPPNAMPRTHEKTLLAAKNYLEQCTDYSVQLQNTVKDYFLHCQNLSNKSHFTVLELLIIIACSIAGALISSTIVSVILLVIRFISSRESLLWWEYAILIIGTLIGGFIGFIIADDYLPLDSKKRDAKESIHQQDINLMKQMFCQYPNQPLDIDNANAGSAASGTLSDCIYLMQRLSFIDGFSRNTGLPYCYESLLRYARRIGNNDDLHRFELDISMFNLELIIFRQVIKDSKRERRVMSACLSNDQAEYRGDLSWIGDNTLENMLERIREAEVYYQYHKRFCDKSYPRLKELLIAAEKFTNDDRMIAHLNRFTLRLGCAQKFS